jgi:hypothetical protein
MAAAARGKISPGEGMGLAKLVDFFLKAVETHDRLLENPEAPV